MKTIVCERPNHFSMRNEKAPQRSQGNTLLAVKRIGICGTDLHAFQGNQPFFSYPRILGHELAATVVEPDDQDNRLKAGDPVVIMPYINCGLCVACRSGKTNCCQSLNVFGVHSDGGMREYINFPTHLLIPSSGLSLEEIALVEPLSIGAHALKRAGTQKGDTVVVAGCGPIGIGLIQQAKILGATVIAVDINGHRLQTVKDAFGADEIIEAQRDAVEKVSRYTQGAMADCVFDATGNQQAIERGPEFMRHGGTYVLVGLFKGPITFQHPAIHAKETSLLCSRNATLDDFNRVVATLKSKQFNTSSYITRREKFEAILTGFPEWSKPDSLEIKVMIDV